MAGVSDRWLYWYWGKEGKVEEGIPALSELFARAGVSSILDIGCGAGRHSMYLARKGFRVSAFDRSEKAIERAKELRSLEGLEIDLRVWDMNQFPYPYDSSSFSAVVSTKVIHHAKLEEIRKIIHEIERIVKREGYVYLEVPTLDKLHRLKVEGGIFEDVEPGTVVHLDGEERGVMHHYFARDELLSSLGGYFEILDVRVLQEHYCLTARKRKRE